ncbi:MAG: FHA domain-containing protein [bacterium]|nr:FHA domain-containing protein [bacterium]
MQKIIRVHKGGNDEMLEDLMMEYYMEMVLEEIRPVIGICIGVMIPFLLLGVAQCFFGYWIYRILLVCSGVLTGGAIGAVILGMRTQDMSGVVGGFLLMGIICGVLAWFAYKVFLFLQAFGTGLMAGFAVYIFSGNWVLGLVLGIILGVVLGVLICIYAKVMIQIVMALSGAYNIAIFFALVSLLKTLTAVPAIFWSCWILFAVGGFLVQYFTCKKRGENPNMRMRAPAGNMMQNAAPAGNMMQNAVPAGNMMQSAPVNMQQQQYPSYSGCKLVGIEGQYKDFEFDIIDTLTIGRDVDRCNVIFPKEANGISRVQCELKRNERTGAVSIVDNYSSYGTRFNGVELKKGEVIYVNQGDIIMFGEDNVFRIQYQITG